ncbi:MAG: Xaa-Pro peptidase family protein [Oscillospiraceae bacterium]|nr:Xaa-Pro peptidase family protein [Oscillospiraceae bacterium]
MDQKPQQLDGALLKDIAVRTERLRDSARAVGAQAMLVTCLSNLIYTTGTIYNGYYYLPVDGDPIHFVIKTGAFIHKNTEFIRKPELILDLLAARGMRPPAAMLIEDTQISYSEAQRLQKVFPDTKFLPASNLLRELRSVKSDYEISIATEGSRRMTDVFRRLPSVIKSGMTDLDLQIEFEYLLRRNGHLGLIRTYGRYMEVHNGQILVGENAISPTPYVFAIGGGGLDRAMPVGANHTTFSEGVSALVDFAGNFFGYVVDMSRTFSIGKPPENAVAAHNASLEIQDMVIMQTIPGAVCGDIYDNAVKIAVERGFGEFFMGYGQQSKFIAHGVGLELNELPVIAQNSKTVIREGMIIAVEPKFTLPGYGAVGTENTFVVRKDGLEKLTIHDDNIIEILG